MKITEIASGTNIKLIAKIQNETIEFDSVIDEVIPNKRIVLASAVYRNDKLITFRGKGLIVDVLVSPTDDKPYLFKNVTLNLMKKSDNTYWYNLVTNAAGKPQNRRRSFR